MTNPNISNYYNDAFLANKAYPWKDVNGQIVELQEYDEIHINSDTYTVIAISNYTTSGYKAYALQDQNGNITISHRGTQISSLSDLTADFQIGIDKLSPQFSDAVAFNNQVLATIQETNPGFNPTLIHHTGHSLGGGIADLMAVASGATATSFNAPIVSHLIDDLKERHPNDFATDTSDLSLFQNRITDIVEEDDFIHTIPPLGQNLGNVITVDAPDVTDQFGNIFGSEYIRLLLSQNPALRPIILAGGTAYDIFAALDAHSMQHLLDLIQYQNDQEQLEQSLAQYADNILNLLKEPLEQQLNQSNSLSSLIETFLHKINLSENITPSPARYDPLTLDLNHNGQIDLVSINNSNAFFDIVGQGLQNKVGWLGDGGTGVADGFLVLDSNNNNKVDNINELFGHSNPDGSETLGTEELAAYDLNSDGKIDINDQVFSDLKIWQDNNGNGQTDAGELSTLTDHNITAINLNTTTVNQIIDGNKIISTGNYEYTTIETNPETSNSSLITHSSVLANLDLAIDFTNSNSYTYQDSQGSTVDYTLNLETLTLPFSRGYGNTKAWHIAMSEDATLLQIMKDIVNLNNPSLQSDPYNTNNQLVTYTNLNSKIEDFIYRWTRTEDITGMRGVK